MASFVEIPPQRLEGEVLTALLQEFVSRDGTDYGAREWSMEELRDILSLSATGPGLRRDCSRTSRWA